MAVSCCLFSLNSYQLMHNLLNRLSCCGEDQVKPNIVRNVPNDDFYSTMSEQFWLVNFRCHRYFGGS